MDLHYFETRLHDAVERASSGSDRCARRAHQGLAQLYFDKLATLRGDARTAAASQREMPRLNARHG